MKRIMHEEIITHEKKTHTVQMNEQIISTKKKNLKQGVSIIIITLQLQHMWLIYRK